MSDIVENGSSNREFGLVFTGFFLIVGLLPHFSKHEIRPWAIGIASLILAFALFWPSILTPFNKIWTKIGILMGKVVSPVILTLFFLLIFTPFAMILRIFKKDLLDLRLSKDLKSYWKIRKNPKITVNSMKHLF